MRRGFGIVMLLLVILAGIAIGVGAYNAGVNHGLAEAQTGGQIVGVVRPGYGYGFFPFGLFLFPLFFFLIFGLFRFAFWPGRWGWDHDHPHGMPGPAAGRFEEWHRRQHEQDSEDHTPVGGEPSRM